MGIIKSPSRRLRDLPFHFTFREVFEGPELIQICDSLDWLYEKGPANKDWYAIEEQDVRIRTKPVDSPFYVYQRTRKYTFAFRERRDAMLFKLLWYDAPRCFTPDQPDTV